MSFSSEANAAHLEIELAAAAAAAEKALEALQSAKDAVSDVRGRYIAPQAWADLLDRERQAGRRHQRALSRVSEIKRQLKAVNGALQTRRIEEQRAAAAEHQLGFAEHFLNTARRLLDPDVFAGLMREATLERNRALIPTTPNTSSGAALGVRAASGGVRQRRAE